MIVGADLNNVLGFVGQSGVGSAECWGTEVSSDILCSQHKDVDFIDS